MCNSKFASMCRFNPIENSATLTASFAKRAGMVGTAEYNYLVSLRKSNPGLVVLKATHASPTPKARSSLAIPLPRFPIRRWRTTCPSVAPRMPTRKSSIIFAC